MAKFNWGKASLRELDPARVQRTVDFSTPDNMVVKKGAKRKRSASTSVWATAMIAMSKARKAHAAGKPPVGSTNRKAKKAAANPKEKPGSKVKQIVPPLTEQQQQAVAETRRAARVDRNLAKASEQQAEMELKKKTHLQAWVAEQDGLTTDRKSLREKWRARLLGCPQKQ